MKPILHKIRGTAFLLMTVVLSQKAFANAAQPGIWNAGGTVFTMLYPEDSLTFKKVRMQEERIFVQLYKGFAVVKGTYLFRNTTNEKLGFKMGYPVNGIYYGGEADLNEVRLDSLSCFSVKARGDWVRLLKEAHPALNHDYKSPVPSGDNWHVWEMTFAPHESQTVDVYFIVNTNNAQVWKGYHVENRNAFIYLLESGNVWQSPIETGKFYVQVMDGLTIEDVRGLSSGFGFRYSPGYRLYAGVKTNFSPTAKDNLVVTYGERNEGFSFETITPLSDILFAKIEDLSHLPVENLAYNQIETGDPYEVESTFWGAFPGLLTLFVFFAPYIIGVVIILIAIWAIMKWIRMNRKHKGG